MNNIGFDFGQIPSSAPAQQYGYDLKTGKWGWGSMGANGFSLPGSGGTNSASKTPSQVIQDIIQNGTNAVPDSLKALGSMSTNTLTSTAGVSAPVQNAANKTADYVSNLVDQGNPDYTGQRVAQLSNPEQTSQDAVMAALRDGGGPGADAMKQATNKQTDLSGLVSAAGPVATKTLADTDISKYMNPAQTAEYDAILHGNDVMNNATRARMAKSGAFGENMQVAQAENNESTKRQLGLASRDAFATAQQGAIGDVAAQNAGAQQNRAAAMGAQTTGVQAQLTDAQRALTGGSMQNSDFLNLTNSAAGAGATARSVQQAGMDAQWQQYLAKLGYGTQLASTASGALAGLPGTKTLTQEQLGPSPGGQEIGAMIGLTGLQNQYNNPRVQGGSISSYSQGGIPGASSFA